MTEMRNNLPWDKNYDYSWMDTLDLLNFFFSEKKKEADAMDVMYLNLDDDRGAIVKSALKALKENKTRIALFCLLIGNPYAVRDETGKPKLHAVMLAVNTEKNEMCYQDPYGLGMDDKLWHNFTESERFMMPQLSVIIRETLPGYRIVQPRIQQQLDDCSSVPVIITNLIYYTLTGNVPETVDIAAVRETHKHILLEADQRREELRWKKYNVCISAVAREIVAQARLEFRISKIPAEIFEAEINHLIKEICVKTRNPAFANLSDERIPPQLTRSGTKLKNALYAALKKHAIIGPAPRQEDGNQQPALNIARLQDETMRGEFFRLIAASLRIDSLLEEAQVSA